MCTFEVVEKEDGVVEVPLLESIQSNETRNNSSVAPTPDDTTEGSGELMHI